jgi:hypothetical protein
MRKILLLANHAGGREKPDFDDTRERFHGPAKFVENGSLFDG